MQQTFIDGLKQMQAGSVGLTVSSSIIVAPSKFPAENGMADDVPEGKGGLLERLTARWETSSDWKEYSRKLYTL